MRPVRPPTLSGRPASRLWVEVSTCGPAGGRRGAVEAVVGHVPAGVLVGARGGPESLACCVATAMLLLRCLRVRRLDNLQCAELAAGRGESVEVVVVDSEVRQARERSNPSRERGEEIVLLAKEAQKYDYIVHVTR